jgi:hypothetical protein
MLRITDELHGKVRPMFLSAYAPKEIPSSDISGILPEDRRGTFIPPLGILGVRYRSGPEQKDGGKEAKLSFVTAGKHTFHPRCDESWKS